jgi:hypothetical protein
VNAVDIDLSVYGSVADLKMDTPAEIEKNVGILSVGVGSQFNTQQLP